MNSKSRNTLAGVFAVLSTLLAAASTLAGTITVVDLPATGTDGASGIDYINNHYVCAFDFGNNGTTPTINGVPFTHFVAINVVTTNATDANFGGTVTLTVGGPGGTQVLKQANSATQGDLAAQADGNMVTLLTDSVYYAPGTTGGWIEQDYGGLTIGRNYSLRVYYRYWGNTVGDRRQDVAFNGEGTQETNSFAEDAGGAHYIQYDFTASSTHVTCVLTNLDSQPFLLYGVTLQDDSPFPPQVVQQPSPAEVNGGSASGFNVVASGTAPLAYQWYFNTSSNYTGAITLTNTVDGRITGAVTNTLTITNTGAADIGYYYCVITNDYGATTSAIANLQVDFLPAVTQQPSSVEVKGGSTADFNVTVGIGAPPFAYQWYFNSSSNYAGATTLTDTVDGRITGSASDTLTITNTGAADIGYYYCVITNDYGVTTSAIAYLQVDLLPVITAQTPTGPFSMFANQTALLSVTVNGGLQGLAYQWFTNGVADAAGTGGTYSASAAASIPGETFQCIVTNDFGSATSAVVTLTAIYALPAAVTNSPYSTNVLALNAAAYFPMHEQAAPVAADIETNYGTLGALGTGYYADWAENGGAPGSSSIQHQVPGALANDPDGAAYLTRPVANNSYLLVPRTSPLTTLQPPFTIELWVKSSNYNFGDMVSQCGTALNAGNANNQYGIRLTWGSSIQTYGSVGQGITAPGLSTNQWHYVVLTCDSSLNWTLYEDNAVGGTHVPGSWRPDTWDPLTIGAGMWNGGGVTRSTDLNLDEVAIYTNALSFTQINNHWQIATNAGSLAGDYFAAVTNDNPVLYYRMDSPTYLGWPATNTWPVLDNYGAIAGNGVYMPGVAPGSVAGPGYSGLPGTNAMPGNGLSAFADAGYSPALDPTGFTPFSVTACFKGNPADSRYQNILGHSDDSWRLAVSQLGQVHFNVVPGGGNDAVSTGVYNDGNWHQVVGVYDGTSNYVYVDGVLDGESLVGTNAIPGSTDDVLLGADPQYLTANTGAGRQFAGNLCEVAFFTNALTAAEIQSLYETIGVPVSITSGPVLSRVGSSDVFTVTAIGSTPAYQWYYNTVSNYSGATALTDVGGVSGSTTPSVTINNLQDYYFVVVTNGGSSVTSSIVQVPQLLTALSAGKPIWNQTSNSIVVMFSDPVDPVTAATAGNYGLDNGASVSSAALVAANEVVLTTSALEPSTTYTLTVQNVQNYYGVTQTPVSTNLVLGVYPVNLALWVRADTGVSTNGDGTVSQWDDMSGNGNTLWGGDYWGFTDPLLTTNASGDPAVYFNSTNGDYGSALYANDAPSLRITRDMSIIAVVNFMHPSFGGADGEIVSKTGLYHANIPAPYDYYCGWMGAHLYRGNGNTPALNNYGQFAGSGEIPTNAPQILAVSETGNTVTHYLNGAVTGSGLLAAGGYNFDITNCADGGQPFFVGGRFDFTYNHLTGYLSELIIAGSAISSYDVDSLGKYLTEQHNLPIAINTNPTNLVFSVTGSQLTLSWPADHTGWTLQAQTNGLSMGLSTNWVNVSGSETTNQVIIPVSPTNGCVFYRLIYPAP